MGEKLTLLLVSIAGVAIAFGFICLHARKRLRELSDDPTHYPLRRTKPNRTFPKPWLMAGERIAKADDIPPDDPPLGVGDECIFISYTGPVMLVVDVSATHVLASWDDGHQEHKFPRTTVRRWKPDEMVKPRKRVSA